MDAGNPRLELQDAFERLPKEIHHKMLPASRIIELRRTSRMMRTAVEEANAVLQVRDGNQFPDGRGLRGKLIGLSAWCKVTVLRLKDCRLRRTGASNLAEDIASFLFAYLVELDLEGNDIQEGGGRALAKILRLNTVLTSINLGRNGLGERGGRALADTLRLNTSLTEINLWGNDLGEGGGRALA